MRNDLPASAHLIVFSYSSESAVNTYMYMYMYVPMYVPRRGENRIII